MVSQGEGRCLMAEVEYADGYRRSPFPSDWGRPPGETYSEERARWVKSKVRESLRGASTRHLRLRQMSMLLQVRQRAYEGQSLYEEGKMPKGGSIRKSSPARTNPAKRTRPGTWGKPPQNPQWVPLDADEHLPWSQRFVVGGA